MFLSMNWIGDFVDLSGLDKQSLIRNFTLSTAEVEDILVKGADTYGVVVAKILSVEAHPSSKKLHLLKVDRGTEVVDIVCGAPNVREGMLVALATDGGCVAGHEIRTATVGGFVSHGMCCSMAELGLSDDNSGIWEIPDELPLGTDIKTVYPIDDIIFEVDNKSVTNRPDLWGHYGMAREFATITGRELRPVPVYNTDEFASLPPVAVEIRTERAFRYTALKVENILRTESPVWMQIRLYYCGSRAINFLADLTNYVMLELGQPMHAFDNRKVDRIEVQTFPEPFAFTTLDGVERKIGTETVMITSADAPVAIAGVMGGDASKIEDDTTSLLLESATFDGVSVRKTTTALGLRTDASMRYEKMLDPELCRTATERLLYLLKEYDSACRVISAFTDVYPYKYETITLTFDKAYVDMYTGIDISTERIERTLRSLGFGLQREGDVFTVTVPSWRATKDVTIKADIIEEITRIYGYDNFEIKTAKGALRPVAEEKHKSEEDRMKDILVGHYRMHEVHSYIWSDEQKNRALGIETPKNVRIINAQTPEHQYLRTSMIPTLLSFVKENRAFADSFSLFEIGHVVEGLREDGYCNECKKLGAVLYSHTEDEEALFHTAVAAARELVADLLHKELGFVREEVPSLPFAHPANAFALTVDGECIGHLGVPHPAVLASIDKKGAVAFLEINTNRYTAHAVKPIAYREPSRFPAIDIDLTFHARAEEVDLVAVRAAAKDAAGEVLDTVRVQDIYEGEDGCALTLRFSFLSNERTLTKGELSPATDAILGALSPLGLTFKA